MLFSSRFSYVHFKLLTPCYLSSRNTTSSEKELKNFFLWCLVEVRKHSIVWSQFSERQAIFEPRKFCPIISMFVHLASPFYSIFALNTLELSAPMRSSNQTWDTSVFITCYVDFVQNFRIRIFSSLHSRVSSNRWTRYWRVGRLQYQCGCQETPRQQIYGFEWRKRTHRSESSIVFLYLIAYTLSNWMNLCSGLPHAIQSPRTRINC